jgi:hypothetical protein
MEQESSSLDFLSHGWCIPVAHKDLDVDVSVVEKVERRKESGILDLLDVHSTGGADRIAYMANAILQGQGLLRNLCHRYTRAPFVVFRLLEGRDVRAGFQGTADSLTHPSGPLAVDDADE